MKQRGIGSPCMWGCPAAVDAAASVLQLISYRSTSATVIRTPEDWRLWGGGEVEEKSAAYYL